MSNLPSTASEQRQFLTRHLPQGKLSLSSLIFGTSQVCEVANVHIENEDGSHQVVELKNLEPVPSGAYVLCSNRRTEPPHISRASTGMDRICTPFQRHADGPGEVATACEAGRNDLPTHPPPPRAVFTVQSLWLMGEIAVGISTSGS
ncbi:hypothetical protein BaRGS_00000446 [Batillaria attramentaria]|uniref:Uncharacterized protein n=1 Tax=Batillaria attramentaria TaxID=370345 RepID=A0ABD0M9G5_9CAEN